MTCPLLFLLYISYLSDNLQCYSKLFADETSLFYTVTAPKTTAIKLNNELDEINKWDF